MFISGLHHCHVPHLDSYVIRDRVSDGVGMIRVFHNLGNSLVTLFDIRGDYRLAPHNHHQTITLYRLYGDVVNVDFHAYAPNPKHREYEYSFGSALATGSFELNKLRSVSLILDQIVHIPEDGLTLPWMRIHTVVSSPNSAWMVFERQLAPPQHKSLCYSKNGRLRFSSDGLYKPMNKYELHDAYHNLLPIAATDRIETLMGALT